MNLLNCDYYPTCGGCQLLHLAAEDYISYKQTLLHNAFNRYGISVDVSPLIELGPSIRRRATFKMREGKVGFFAPQSHRLVPLKKCNVLTAELSALLKPLGGLCRWFPKGCDIEVTHSDTGFDINILGNSFPLLSLTDLEALTSFIQHQGWARFSLRGSIFLQNHTPQVVIDQVPVALRPGSFLQASTLMEKTLGNLIHQTIPPFRRALDLFCGRGTLALPLSRLGAVDGFEIDEGAVKDLSQAARAHNRSLTVKMRDLFNHPLKDKELKGYEWIVLNPPRAGAPSQIKALANVPANLLYISCCPETLARDCKILKKTGRTIRSVQPIDAFYGSHHLETVVHIQ